MTQVNIIAPNNLSIDKNSNICVISDHMPAVPAIDYSKESIKTLYGYNTIEKVLEQSMPHVDTLIFDHYQHIDIENNNYKIFFIEKFLNNTLKYYNTNKNNRIDFTKKIKKFNYLSNKPREARVLTSAWIANNYINDDSCYNHTQSYEYADFKDLLNEFIIAESLTIESKMLPKKWVSYDTLLEKKLYIGFGMTYAPNPINFYNKIKDEIAPTVFSIVMEPVFWEHGCILTEKYVNAVFGGTIPIINGYRVYDNIKEMGLDTFEDIIDISAQFEKNPIYRILNLLEKNKTQLDNALEIIKDTSVQQRLVNNIKILENYNWNLARSRYLTNGINFLINFFK